MSVAQLGKIGRVMPQRIRVTKNFYLDELVDPYTYFSDDDHGRGRLDDDAINCLQLLRDLCGHSLTVNNWWKTYVQMYMNGDDISSIIRNIENSRTLRKYSGFRPEHCKIGSKRSAHKIGKAFDIKGDESELFGVVEGNARKFYETGLKRLENPKLTRGWLHIDTEPRNHTPNKIRVINLRTHAFDIKI